MRKAKISLVAFAVMGLCVAAFYKPPTDPVPVKATVLDEKHHPIRRAMLSVTYPDGQALVWHIPRVDIQPISSDTGYVQAEAPNPGRYSVEAWAAGYKASKQTVNIQPGSPSLTLVLKKE